MRAVTWGNFDPQFVDEIVRWIGHRSVLEVFAGNGYLARLLSTRGIDIISTSLFSGHDGHTDGMYFDVLELDAVSAVREYGSQSDCLLMAWPVASEAAAMAAVSWGSEKPILFVGEVSDFDLGFGGLSGCASDLFFELTVDTHRFDNYRPRSGLDQASVRNVDPMALKKVIERGGMPVPPCAGSFPTFR